MKVLCFGSLNLDHVYRVHSIVRPGETISSLGVETHCGGKGLNQSIALAKAGAPVWHAGAVGDDGQMLVRRLQDAGVHTNLIEHLDGPNGSCVIQVDDRGQNSIVLFGGTNQRITETYVDEVFSHFEKGDLVLLQNEISCLPYILGKAASKQMTIILNPSPMTRELMATDLSAVSLFILNEVEGGDLTGETDPDRILDALASRFPGAEAVLTLGGSGSCFRGNGETIRQEAYPVQAVDTTAAGDTFTGYFIADYYASGDAKHALDLASRASAIAVTRPGAADSIPLRADVPIGSITSIVYGRTLC
ncbi:MAG: ribokinase [Chordicoccus sp.]